MTKQDDKVKAAVEDKKTAGATEEQKTDKTSQESAQDASDKAAEAEADRASRGDPNAGSQDEGLGAKGPGQSSGETTKTINAADLRDEPAQLADTKGLGNEDVVLTDHEPQPDEPMNKLEADQLHQAADGRIRTGEGKVASHFSWDKLENINDIFHRMEEGKIDGRIVLDLAA